MNPTPDYSDKTDDELLALASDVEDLTPEARSVLVAELKGRSLNAPSRVEELKEEQQQYELNDDVDRAHQPLIYGCGRRIFGRTNVETVGTGQEYDATIFAVVARFPLVPLGTYRFSNDGDCEHVVQKKELNWSQVALVWAKGLAIVLGIMILIPLLARAKW